jgi:hypothetical protein
MAVLCHCQLAAAAAPFAGKRLGVTLVEVAEFCRTRAPQMKMKMRQQSSSRAAASQAQRASQASSSCPPLPSELLFHDHQDQNSTLSAMNSGTVVDSTM